MCLPGANHCLLHKNNRMGCPHRRDRRRGYSQWNPRSRQNTRAHREGCHYTGWRKRDGAKRPYFMLLDSRILKEPQRPLYPRLHLPSRDVVRPRSAPIARRCSLFSESARGWNSKPNTASVSPASMQPPQMDNTALIQLSTVTSAPHGRRRWCRDLIDTIIPPRLRTPMSHNQLVNRHARPYSRYRWHGSWLLDYLQQS